MPIIIGGVTLTKIMIDSIECKKAIIGGTTVFEVVSNYTVNFIAKGSIVSTKSVAAGGTTTLPSNPSRSGWTFIKWVYGVSNTQFTTSTVVNSNINVYAYWYQYGYVGQETCWMCYGSGQLDYVQCIDCGGSGMIFTCPNCGKANTWDEDNSRCAYCYTTQYPVEITCSNCDGLGTVPGYQTCDTCQGSGVLDVYDDVYEAY